jgi:APA family basic amino acid/polyamine antiporter
MAPPRELGFWSIVALVMGNMIGSGVFLLPSSLAPFGGGITVIGWVVSAGGSVMLALVFARLARLHPAAGGPYAYTRAAFGDLAAFLVSWSYWISIWASLAALAVAFVGYLDPFLPRLVRNPATAGLMAVASVWTLAAVNIRGVGLAGRVQLATTAIKIVPLAVVGIAGLAAFQPARFAVEADGAGAIGAGIMSVVTLTLWAFLGLESGTIPASRTVDPARTIPRATIAGTIIAAGIYIASTVGVMSLVPLENLATSTAPFADAARVLGGEWAARLVAIGAAISCFGALNGWMLMVGQMPLAAASDGLFPRPFGRLSARHTPFTGIVIAGVLATTLVAMNSSRGLVALFTFIILLSTLGTLVPYLFCSLASLLMREPGGSTVTAGAAAIGIGAFVYAMIAVGGAGAEAVYWGFLLLLSGLPVYVWVVRGRVLGAVA